MQDTVRRRNFQTKKKRIRTGILVVSCIICIITSITIMVKSRFSNNSVAGSANKVRQNQVNVGSYKNEGDPVKSDNKNVAGETEINLDNKTNVQAESGTNSNSKTNIQAEGAVNLDNETNAKPESGTN